ncbi:MAG: PDR/VanB family oxidoreductase [Gammaproteobacteria bacterium]|nr:PDR/VanB family oxidoreductase [Gammaproteobacteria bacterium]
MSGSRFEVVSVDSAAASVKSFKLRSVDGKVPSWSAGAHVRVSIPGGGSRAYSLMRMPQLADDMIALGVLLEDPGTGGSAYMHSLSLGEQVELSAPVNQFELGQHPYTVLIAGGIGITPILSMCAELQASGREYRVHYAGRTQGSLAFVAEMQAICGDCLQLHFDDQPDALFLPQIVMAAGSDAHIYCCGPAGLIDAVKKEARVQGWGSERIHFELFSNDENPAENSAFEVEIHATGQVIPVAADQSIIDALEDAGLDPLYDCQRGDCGICQCDVIEGIPDHRDVILTDDEKASNRVMQICVSRAKTPRLVIDL